MTNVRCPRCKGSGWVCEDHGARPSDLVTDGGCACGGAAVPCECNPDAVIEMAVIATVDPESVREWVQ